MPAKAPCGMLPVSYSPGIISPSDVITRGGVIVQFSESSEGKRRLAGPTNITLISLAMLRSVPTPAVWNALYPTIDAGERQAAWIGRQVLASAAYDARFP